MTAPGEPRPPGGGESRAREPGAGKLGTDKPAAAKPAAGEPGTGEPGTGESRDRESRDRESRDRESRDRVPTAAKPDGPHGPGTGRAGYLDMRVGEFLDELAAAQPAPGGGSAAALGLAFAAALCAMTAELSARHLAGAPGLAAEARGLLHRAAPLAQADADAYADVLAALRAPRQPDGRQREEQISAALARASAVPLEVAEIGDRAAALAADVADRGNPNVRGDALAAAQLAAAAAQTAAALVQINLVGMPDDPRPAQAAQWAAHAAHLAAQSARPPGSRKDPAPGA